MKKLLTTLFLTPLALTACGEEQLIIKIAILPTEVTGDTLSDETKGIVQDIKNSLPEYTIEPIRVTNTNAAKTAIINGQVDMVWSSTATFWSAEAEAAAFGKELDILLTPAPKGDITLAGYYSIIGTHIDNARDFEGLKTQNEKIKALKEKSFAFSTKTSTSGGKLPREVFWENTNREDYTEKNDIFNSNTYLGDVSLTGEHSTTILNILQKSVYAGAYWDQALPLLLQDESLEFKESDMFEIMKIQAPGDPLWYNKSTVDSVVANRIVNHLTTLDNETMTEGVFGPDSAYFLDETYRWTKTDKTHKSYQTIRSLDINIKR